MVFAAIGVEGTMETIAQWFESAKTCVLLFTWKFNTEENIVKRSKIS